MAGKARIKPVWIMLCPALIPGGPAVTRYGDLFAQVPGFCLNLYGKKSFDSGKVFSGFPKAEASLPKTILVNRKTYGVKPHCAGKVNRSVNMEFLGNDDKIVHFKNIPGPVHGIVGTKPRVIHKDVFFTNRGTVQRIAPHSVYLVVVRPAVIARKQKLAAFAGFNNQDTRVYSVPQYRRRSALPNLGAQHQYGGFFGKAFHIPVDEFPGRKNHAAVYAQRKNKKKDKKTDAPPEEFNKRHTLILAGFRKNLNEVPSRAIFAAAEKSLQKRREGTMVRIYRPEVLTSN
jgi:hypothetical protein